MIKLELNKNWYFFVLENDDVTWKPRIQMNVWRIICLLCVSSGKTKKAAVLAKEQWLRGQELDLSNGIKIG